MATLEGMGFVRNPVLLNIATRQLGNIDNIIGDLLGSARTAGDDDFCQRMRRSLLSLSENSVDPEVPEAVNAMEQEFTAPADDSSGNDEESSSKDAWFKVCFKVRSTVLATCGSGVGGVGGVGEGRTGRAEKRAAAFEKAQLLVAAEEAAKAEAEAEKIAKALRIQEAEEREKNEPNPPCILCMDGKKEYFIDTCRHANYCTKCYLGDKMWEGSRLRGSIACPQCKSVGNVLKIFM